MTVLNAIYEEDFLGISYGFRPGRSQHDALDALWVGLTEKKVSWVLDADIRGFFDTINHDCLMQFVERRIADPRMLRLIRKWLRAGVSEDGKWSATLKAIRDKLWRDRHESVQKLGDWLGKVVRGWLNYHAVPGNTFRIEFFRDETVRHWYRALKRRGQKCKLTWEKFGPIALRWVPRARIQHPYPSARFHVKYAR